ncbi:ADP-heptose:LPS heptosyltransferase [Salinibacter ruber]|uniref:glycosyltransferase family 9 protein n=1 Tax=Salinibacter ruber TaxID=146919 RepID=UPI002167BA1A|nr:glycosyltransferase family 9 protein [Salinibacter ruber]MCS4034092.1 ADP-heptose:LPS heptosyltransferase [Salinibacter ruber]
MSTSGLKKWAVAARDVGLFTIDPLLAYTPDEGGENNASKLARPPETDNGTENVLTLRLDAIGDFVLWLDAAEGLRSYYEDAEITLVGNALWTDLAERLPYFDHVIPVNPYRFRHHLGYRRQILQRVTETSYREAMHVSNRRTGRFADADAILRAVHADRKVALQGDAAPDWQVRWSNCWYTDVLSVDQEAMELQRNAECVRNLGAHDFQAGVPTLPEVHLPSVNGLSNSCYVLFPGAGADYRRWPLDRFADIAGRIYRKTGWTGLVCGGPGEEHLGDALCRKADAELENWVGRTSIPELAAVIASVRMLLGNETSAVHIATAVRTPSVCILGGGHYGRFVPYDVERAFPDRPMPRVVVHKMPCFGCDWNCCFDVADSEPVPCVDRISTDAVWDCVERALNEASPTNSLTD